MATRASSGALGARVDNLEVGVSAIRGDIAELRQLVVASQKTPWSTLIAAAGFIVLVTTAFSQLSLQPIRDSNSRNTDDITEIRSNLVSRGEHTQRWVKTDADIASVQRQIDQIRNDFGNTYSLHDALTDINKRLDKIEDGNKR